MSYNKYNEYEDSLGKIMSKKENGSKFEKIMEILVLIMLKK